MSALHGSSAMASVLGDSDCDKGGGKQADIFDICFIMIISDNTYTSSGTSKNGATSVGLFLDKLHK